MGGYVLLVRHDGEWLEWFGKGNKPFATYADARKVKQEVSKLGIGTRALIVRV